MCVAFIALVRTTSANAPIKLLVAFNRDEDYARPTKACAVWPSEGDDEAYEIFGARDELGGGTWFAMCRKTGRWGLVTNAANGTTTTTTTTTNGGTTKSPKKTVSAYVTRGMLVTDYLKSPEIDSGKYAMEVFAKRMRFDGFNLVVGDASRGTAHYVGNRGSANAETPMELRAGRVYGLANDVLDAPWPKVVRGKAKLEEILRAYSRYSADALPTRALEEQVLRDVLHAPLDARPLAIDAAERLSYSSSDGDAPAPSAAARELWRHQQSFVAGGRRRESHVDCDDDVDASIDIDVDEDDEEDEEFVVEQIEACESERSFVRPGELPGRPNCGTRTSQVVLVSADGRCSWCEHHFVPVLPDRRRARRPAAVARASAAAPDAFLVAALERASHAFVIPAVAPRPRTPIA